MVLMVNRRALGSCTTPPPRGAGARDFLASWLARNDSPALRDQYDESHAQPLNPKP